MPIPGERTPGRGSAKLIASDATARSDLDAAAWHDSHNAGRDRKIRSHLRQLQALGLEVTLTPAAQERIMRSGRGRETGDSCPLPGHLGHSGVAI
jgi:hypothetical protein